MAAINDPEIELRLKRLSELRGEEDTFDKLITNKYSVETARYQLTRTFVYAFLAYLFFLGAFIWIDGDTQKTATGLEIAKTLFLPIVALMIGHYFGSKSSE